MASKKKIKKDKALVPSNIPCEDGYCGLEADGEISYARKLKLIDGKPTVILEPSMLPADRTNLIDIMNQALNLPYDGKDPRFMGLTKGVAIVVSLVDDASKGNSDARKELLDRMVGKPIQNIKSLSIKGTMEDFLDSLASPSTPKDEATIDVTSSSPSAHDEAMDL